MSQNNKVYEIVQQNKSHFCNWFSVTEQMSVHSNDSRNTYSPSFQLDVDYLLEEFPESDREEEAAQVKSVKHQYKAIQCNDIYVTVLTVSAASHINKRI